MEASGLEPLAKRAKLDDGVKADGGNAVQENANSQHSKTPSEADAVVPTLREPDVGITEYVNKDTPKFFGVLKERFSDFMVHEIRADGTIVRLTDTTTVPQLPGREHDVSASEGHQFTDEQRSSLQELAERKDRKRYADIESSDDKETRKAIHHAIREQFPMLSSSMKDKTDGSKVIRVKYSGGVERRVTFGVDSRYCKFVLYKENRDTHDAISLLARNLGGKPRSIFATCGLKDRRALTTQEVTVCRVLAEQLARMAPIRTLKVGNFEYTGNPMKIGTHYGNHFTIVLRHFDGNEEGLSAGMESLMKLGFVNYFGMQRFGSGACGTHLYGKALLAGRYNEAIELILSSLAYIPNGDSRYEAYRTWKETNDPAAAKAYFKRPCQESDILNGLVKHGVDNPIEAFGYLQQSTLSFYFHAYQSWIWNQITSRRLSEFGLQPVIGDLVLPSTDCGRFEGGDCTAEESTASDKSDAQGDAAPDSDSAVKGAPVQYVTAENISQFTIHNVVLPLPGLFSRYPNNAVREWYRALLAVDGIDMDKFPGHIRLGRQFVALAGGYRHVVVKPENVSWKLLHYNSNHIPLAVSDVDLLAGKTEVDDVAAEEAQFCAARLEFSLKTSSYATMAIREVCQVDTSQAHQRLMSTDLAKKKGPTATTTAETTATTAAEMTAMTTAETTATTAAVIETAATVTTPTVSAEPMEPSAEEAV